MSGTLYLVGTPIGNLGDLSPRAAEILESVDFIAAEDTRVTLKLLNHLGIKKQLISYYEHNKIESAAVIPSKLTHALIAPAFGSSYGLIQNRRFAKMQFRSLRIRDDYFEEYYRDTCRIAKEDMIAFMRANTAYALKDSIRNTQAEVHVIFGERETREIRRSAEMIAQTIPACTLHLLPGLCHGEFSLNRPDAYAERIRQITGGETL